MNNTFYNKLQMATDVVFEFRELRYLSIRVMRLLISGPPLAVARLRVTPRPSVCPSVCPVPVPFTERADTPFCRCAGCCVNLGTYCQKEPLSSRPSQHWPTHLLGTKTIV